MPKPAQTLERREIDAVNAAGIAGYLAGYAAARALGATHEQAKTAGELGSSAEDALNGE